MGVMPRLDEVQAYSALVSINENNEYEKFDVTYDENLQILHAVAHKFRDQHLAICGIDLLLHYFCLETQKKKARINEDENCCYSPYYRPSSTFGILQSEPRIQFPF